MLVNLTIREGKLSVSCPACAGGGCIPCGGGFSEDYALDRCGECGGCGQLPASWLTPEEREELAADLQAALAELRNLETVEAA